MKQTLTTVWFLRKCSASSFAVYFLLQIKHGIGLDLATTRKGSFLQHSLKCERKFSINVNLLLQNLLIHLSIPFDISSCHAWSLFWKNRINLIIYFYRSNFKFPKAISQNQFPEICFFAIDFVKISQNWNQ